MIDTGRKKAIIFVLCIFLFCGGVFLAKIQIQPTSKAMYYTTKMYNISLDGQKRLLSQEASADEKEILWRRKSETILTFLISNKIGIKRSKVAVNLLESEKNAGNVKAFSCLVLLDTDQKIKEGSIDYILSKIVETVEETNNTRTISKEDIAITNKKGEPFYPS